MKIALIALVVIGLIVSGLFIAKGPQPEIIVPAEVLWKLGPLNISNTMLTAWVVMAFLVVLTFLGTRTMKLLPGGFQNFLEAVVNFLVDQMADIAGEKNARRFFPVVATIFLFVIVSNWMGLLPFFNAIGKTEDVGHVIFHDLTSDDPHKLHFDKDGKLEEDAKVGGWVMEKSSGMVLSKPGGLFGGGKSVEFEAPAGATRGEVLDHYIVFLAAKFGDLEVSEEELHHPSAETVKAAAAHLDTNPKAPKLLKAAATDDHGEGAKDEGEHGAEHGVESEALHEEITGIDFSASKKMGLVIPFFRSVFSDVNNTLALGLIAFGAIEFWGLRTLGMGYLGKFFVNPFKNPIMMVVGLLELLSEFIRIISFTFRLFGNIFAGEVLILMLTFLMPFVLVDIIYGLELFVGFIQAAVFAMLTLVFATMAVEAHGEDHEGAHGEGHGDHHEGTAQAAH